MYLDVHVVSRPAPEHRGKYAIMPRKQICREFPLHSSPNPHDHSLLARHRSRRRRRPPPLLGFCHSHRCRLGRPGSSSSNLKQPTNQEREPEGETGECSWSVVRPRLPVAAVAASLPLFSPPEGKVIRTAGCVNSHCACAAKNSRNFFSPHFLSLFHLLLLLLLLQWRRWANFKSWERFSFGVVLLPPPPQQQQRQQIRRPQDR